MSRTTLAIIVLGLFVLCCCFVVVFSATAYVFFSEFDPRPAPTPQAQIVQPSSTPRPSPTPRADGAPAPPVDSPVLDSFDSAQDKPISGFETEDLLLSVAVPIADPIDLAARLRPELGQVARVVNEHTPHFDVGDEIEFWVSNTDTDTNFQIKARLWVKSVHLYMWVEVGRQVDLQALRRSADLFDNQIYPTNRAFFGSEWSPGIDNDPRLHVLHATGIGSNVAGYFSSADEIPSVINPYSNEKEMFYINLDNTLPGTLFYNAVLAHEFQHMIHWYQDRNETTWLNEGASELATQLNGLGRSEGGLRPDQVFASNPDLQLNTWPDNEQSYAHYGNAYLFMNYFLSRFGDDATKALVADPLNGMESVDNVLRVFGYDFGADDLFADWVIANWVDDPTLLDGRWGYPDYDPDPMATAARHRSLPAAGSDDVHQYAADYIRISAAGDVNLTFQGATTARLAATEAYSGRYAWWGNRVDESDARLTLPVDLSGASTATLRYRIWYDIEELWDYGYVMVSTNEGQTWTILETDLTTHENPQGTAYGPGYTGYSSPDGPAWVLEEVDLTPFAGQPIQVRFEYITDAAVTMPGMFIDDVEIPEIGYFNDFEDGPGEWQSEGWLLTDNVLRQRWAVQVIETRADGSVDLHRMQVGQDGRGTLNLRDLSRGEDIILVVSALAPVTVEKASYSYEVSAAR